MKSFICLSVFVVLIFTLFTVQDAHATTVTAATSGDWNTGSTWVGGVVPAAADDKIIPIGVTVTVSTDIANSGIITVSNTGSIGIARFGTSGNSGTITNFGTITNSGIINNNGIFNNKCGATYSGNPSNGNPINNLSCLSTLSGIVFADTNGNGIQSLNESGIAGRTVILVDGNGTRLADQITNSSGSYTFTGIASGTLLVQTVPVPQNHLPSAGFHSYARPTISPNSNTIVNFPMTPITLPNRATVNGTVFEDTNNNGVQDLGESGLANVQVFVVDFLTLTQTTVLTDVNGVYTASGILPDVVLIQAAPIPGGHLPHTTTYSYQTLAQGSTTTVNFALKPVTLPDQGTIIIDVFNDVNSNGIRDITETGVSGATVFTFELLTAQANVQVTGLSGATTHSGLIPDVVLAQINAVILPPGFTSITTANGGFEFVQVTPNSTTTVKIGLH